MLRLACANSRWGHRRVCGNVIYDAHIVFTVDLDSERVGQAEVYAESLSHADTGLAHEATPAESQRLHQRARALMEGDPTSAKLVWTLAPYY